MHDPNTVAFTIRSPFRRRDGISPKGVQRYYRNPIVTIWHRDACRPGFGYTDDTCGWFMRSTHGDPAVLAEIIKRFAFDWDTAYTSKKEDHDDDDGPFEPRVTLNGWFTPEGDPRFSVQAIVLNLFFVAANVAFASDGRTNWQRSKRFLKKHHLDIVLFAENNTDSLFDSITRRYQKMFNEVQTPSKREDRIEGMAATIYGWILRADRPWYKHPRWHVVHWRPSKRTFAGYHFPVPFRGWSLQIHPWDTFRRWALSRCARCGGRFKWGECPTSFNWNKPPLRFMRGEEGVYHDKCAGGTAAAVTPPPPSNQ